MAFLAFMASVAVTFLFSKIYLILSSDEPLNLTSLYIFVPFITLLVVKLLFFKATKADVQKSLVVFNANAEETEGPFVADIVAVHGLASNPETAWEAWDAPGPRKPVWLRDFLPKEGLNCRVMTFNHNTTWASHAAKKSLMSHGDDLLQCLKKKRHGTKASNRPIIFIGHSAGGLIIKQALIRAQATSGSDPFNKSLCEQVKGIIFLGTPHRGSNPYMTTLGRLKSLVFSFEGSNTLLLDSVAQGSVANEALHVTFMDFVKEQRLLRRLKLVSVYETRDEVLFRAIRITVVEKESAMIDGEKNPAWELSHCNLQRFATAEDKHYRDIVSWLRDGLANAENLLDYDDATNHKDQGCLPSLWFPGMDNRFHGVKKESLTTCKWLLNHNIYQEWLKSSEGLMWICGNPGAGKSTLMKYAIQNFKKREISKKIAVASFFFNGHAGSSLQNTPLGFYRSLLHQLCRQIPEMLSNMTEHFEDKMRTTGDKNWRWEEAELQDLLERFILDLPKDYSIRIFIDGLDESGEETARDLAEFFRRIVKEMHADTANFKICISCRHYPVITAPKEPKICIESENRTDIITYVQSSLEDTYMSDSKKAILKDIIVNQSSGIFQWVTLVTKIAIKHCNDGKTMEFIQAEIRTMSGLNQIYRKILDNLPDASLGQSLQLMEWIYFAERPLSPTELRFAIMADSTSIEWSSIEHEKKSKDFVRDNEQMERSIASRTGGLAEVKTFDGRQIVQFVHQSVREYLCQEGFEHLSQLSSDISPTYNVGVVQSRLAKACLTYVKMRELLIWTSHIDKLREKMKQTKVDSIEIELRDFPLLDYAIWQWPRHSAKADKQGVDQRAVLTLFDWPERTLQHHWLSLRSLTRNSSLDKDILTTGYESKLLLHVAADFGITSLARAMFEQPRKAKVEMEHKCRSRNTPLWLAARNGNLEIVQLLLAHKANTEVNVDWDGTPLMIASQNGHAEVAELLLENGADINVTDSFGQTALHKACSTANIDTLDVLLRIGVDLEKKIGWKEDTALSVAVNCGRPEIAEYLLKHGANVNCTDRVLFTPLAYASMKGMDSLVTILLDYGADPNQSSQDGVTPLMVAASEGHTAILKQLIEAGAEIDHTDCFGQTALFVAATEGKAAACECLLQTGADVSRLDIRDYDGQHLLSVANGMSLTETLDILAQYRPIFLEQFKQGSDEDI